MMLVRSGGLAESMSRYLIRRIEENPAIVVRTHTEIVALEGGDHLERVQLRDHQAGDGRDARHPAHLRDDRRDAEHALARRVRRARRQGIHQDRTGSVDGRSDRRRAGRCTRPPHLLETSLPGVFAVGDVRGGNIKRVASAVGEGSIAVSFVHRTLTE